MGQTLILTAGCGRVQRWGGPIEEIRPGDVVWFPPAEQHWHGAAPTTALTHIAIQEQLNGKTVDWLEKVSDEEYAGKAIAEGGEIIMSTKSIAAQTLIGSFAPKLVELTDHVLFVHQLRFHLGKE